MFVPMVSGSRQIANVVTVLIRSMRAPIVLVSVEDAKAYGDTKAPSLPKALAAECPVVRISVGSISAVETQVTHDAAIMNSRAEKAATMRKVRFGDLDAATNPKSATLRPPMEQATD
uniref:Uncharacterized protein n=1 Tax=Grammatophora oceanica TaxID=210454 RepID=A0A7S1Y2P4_9STRA|mmetsp:Transcript_18943/g.28022  ORF Transcript_18943/g.28022 Transcript_18943/m.28022 type:complete len:117 (+) Transcript_18943:208-558(+)